MLVQLLDCSKKFFIRGTSFGVAGFEFRFKFRFRFGVRGNRGVFRRTSRSHSENKGDKNRRVSIKEFSKCQNVERDIWAKWGQKVAKGGKGGK